MAIPRAARHPVLAHQFINFMLDPKNALQNYSWLGYQPPLTQITTEQLIGDGYVPAHLTDAIVQPSDFAHGDELLQLSSTGTRLWDDAWSKVRAQT
jgi:spermidine/putrescine transport system substrate-binding protein